MFFNAFMFIILPKGIISHSGFALWSWMGGLKEPLISEREILVPEFHLIFGSGFKITNMTLVQLDLDAYLLVDSVKLLIVVGTCELHALTLKIELINYILAEILILEIS